MEDRKQRSEDKHDCSETGRAMHQQPNTLQGVQHRAEQGATTHLLVLVALTADTKQHVRSRMGTPAKRFTIEHTSDILAVALK